MTRRDEPGIRGCSDDEKKSRGKWIQNATAKPSNIL